MAANNSIWHTIFVGPSDHKPLPDEYKVLAHIKGQGNAQLLLPTIQHYWPNMRTAEGQYTSMTDELKVRLFH